MRRRLGAHRFQTFTRVHVYDRQTFPRVHVRGGRQTYSRVQVCDCQTSRGVHDWLRLVFCAYEPARTKTVEVETPRARPVLARGGLLDDDVGPRQRLETLANAAAAEFRVCRDGRERRKRIPPIVRAIMSERVEHRLRSRSVPHRRWQAGSAHDGYYVVGHCALIDGGSSPHAGSSATGRVDSACRCSSASCFRMRRLIMPTHIRSSACCTASSGSPGPGGT